MKLHSKILKILATLLSLSLFVLPQITLAKNHVDKQGKQFDFQVFQNDLDALLSDEALANELEKQLNDSEITAEIESEIKLAISNSKTSNPKKGSSKKQHKDKKPESRISRSEKTDSRNNQNPNEVAENKAAENKTVSTRKTQKKPYWDTVYALESSAGKRLYRPSNKSRSCKWTNTPCGHHQLSIVALKDIGCTSLKCRSARADYKKSLAMSKKLEKINAKRLKKFGFDNLPDYQKYLVHQQGSAGIKIILKALKGKKTLSKNMLKMMANNSPYSYKHLRRQGSRGAARKFLRFWKEKWKVKSSRRIASR
jgi:hypothetical protein